MIPPSLLNQISPPPPLIKKCLKINKPPGGLNKGYTLFHKYSHFNNVPLFLSLILCYLMIIIELNESLSELLLLWLPEKPEKLPEILYVLILPPILLKVKNELKRVFRFTDPSLN